MKPIGARIAQTSSAAVALAMVAASPGARAQAAGGETANEGDIVVTAMKREERLQDVGATIQALSAESIRTARVYLIQAALSPAQLERVRAALLTNPVVDDTTPGARPAG